MVMMLLIDSAVHDVVTFSDGEIYSGAELTS